MYTAVGWVYGPAPPPKEEKSAWDKFWDATGSVLGGTKDVLVAKYNQPTVVYQTTPDGSVNAKSGLRAILTPMNIAIGVGLLVGLKLLRRG